MINSSLYRLMPWIIALALMAACPVSADEAPPLTEDVYTNMRKLMLADIAEMARATETYTGRPVFSPRVMAAMEQVPRHEYVPEAYRDRAYENRPQPIGAGQTISQPYIVALMTELLDIEPHHKILEVGTGSGYQAAVLAELAATVHSIEIIESLGLEAKARLAPYANVTVDIGDGYAGKPEAAPFDGIIVTAAAPHIPRPLLDQLKPEGRMVIPVGAHSFTQSLWVVTKDSAGKISKRNVLPVAFVPLTGEH